MSGAVRCFLSWPTDPARLIRHSGEGRNPEITPRHWIPDQVRNNGFTNKAGRINKRCSIRRPINSIWTICLGLIFLALFSGCARQAEPPLRIGVIHALTGTSSMNEKALVDAVHLAVDELNAAGGVLGRQVEVIVADSRSNAAHAAQQADQLISFDNVDVLFACWTSQCRKAVKEVVELHNHLLFYPLQYEGLENSPNVVYTGATANQQIIPGTDWAFKNLGKRVFLLGSDYIFPRLANFMIHDQAQARQADVVRELYMPLGSQDFTAVADAIAKTRPDVVLNTLNGDSNVAFFKALQQAGLSDVPVMSFSVDASSLPSITPFGQHSHYAVWGYFQGLQSPENQRFLQAWHARKTRLAGDHAVTTDAIEASYVGVKLWAQAVTAAGNADPSVVRLAVKQQSLAAPSGILAVDFNTAHLWKPVHIGKVSGGKVSSGKALSGKADTRAPAQDGFEIVAQISQSMRPEPFPSYRLHKDWDELVGYAELQILAGQK